MGSNDIEEEIKACGADVAPRITPQDIEANIASEWYFTADDGVTGDIAALVIVGNPDAMLEIVSKGADLPDVLSLLTFCVLVLRNGFTVTGESACASPENFNAEIGRKVARQNAINKVWPLMGYALKESLSA